MHRLRENVRSWVAAGVFIAALAAGLAHAADLAEAVGDGMAPGDQANARELALTDALRDAVRKGVGVDLLSATQARDFQLDYDRVFAAAFGYVREYTILKCGLGEDGIYRVQVRARVGAGDPAVKDILALRQIVHLKQSPRMALELDELIEGVPAGSDLAASWFEGAARQMQLHVVDVRRAARQDDRLAARDEVLGDTRTARIRRADIAQDADFVIQARVRGHYVGPRPYGALGHVFAVAVDLRALRPDTGAVLVSVPMATREVASDQEAKEAAARDVVHKLLAGTGREDCPGALALYRRVFAQWIAELDLGAIMRLEFAQLADAAHDALLAALRQTPQITAVWPREFDSRALSVVDVESRMDAQGLKGAVLKALGGGFTFDHGTAHALQFRPAAGGGPTEPSAGPAGGGGAASRSGLPPWAWALIGAGAVLAVVGAFALGRRGR